MRRGCFGGNKEAAIPRNTKEMTHTHILNKSVNKININYQIQIKSINNMQ